MVEREGRAAGVLDALQDWDAWSAQLRRRRCPRSVDRVFAEYAKSSPYLWALPADDEFSGTRCLVERLAALGRRTHDAKQVSAWEDEIRSWLDVAGTRAPSAAFGLEALAWTAASPKLASFIAPALWRELLQAIDALHHRGIQLLVLEVPWEHQLAAELGWTLAYLYPEIPPWWANLPTSREALTHGICDLTDGEGWLRAQDLPLIRPLLATWTRCELLARQLEQPCFHQEATQQCRYVVRQAAVLTRRDGDQVLGGSEFSPELFRTAVTLADEKETTWKAAQLLPRGRRLLAQQGRLRVPKRLPRPSNVSEWSRAAILRTNWSRRSPQFTLLFSDCRTMCELSLGKRLIWSGPWIPEISLDGQAVAAHGDVDMVCEFQDQDVEYVELEMCLTDHWRLQRQIMLAKRDGFLLLADAILGNEPAPIDYRCAVPLADHVSFRPASETNEGWLAVGSESSLLALPLALPEWRSERNVGRLATDDGQLVLSQQAHGRAMFCPLFLDLEPRRQGKSYTWRRLTVGEDRQIVRPDVAAAYRVQIGRAQWLIYRSLTGRTGRTVLGQHFLYEYVVGRFPKSGEVDTLLQIELADD